MYREIALKLSLSLFFLLVSVPIQAAELKENQAIVLLRLDTTSVGIIRFKSVDLKNKFRTKSYSSNKRTVTAGEYFVEEMESIYSNIQPIRLKPPISDKGRFVVNPGTVTYLGHWKIGTKFGGRHEYDGKIDFDMDILKKYLKKYPYLKNYPLQIATDAGTVTKLNWEEI